MLGNFYSLLSDYFKLFVEGKGSGGQGCLLRFLKTAWDKLLVTARVRQDKAFLSRDTLQKVGLSSHYFPTINRQSRVYRLIVIIGGVSRFANLSK